MTDQGKGPHTPTPGEWIERGEITTGSMKGFLSIGSHAHPVAFVMRKIDAQHVLLAVNSHARLVAALTQAAMELTEAANIMRPRFPAVASLYDAAAKAARATVEQCDPRSALTPSDRKKE